MSIRANSVGKSCMGAVVKFCGHEGVFVADVFEVGGACVIHASAPVSPDSIQRGAAVKLATHHVVDAPERCFWKPRIGVFVVPTAQLIDLRSAP